MFFLSNPVLEKAFLNNESRTLSDHSEMNISKVIYKGNIKTFHYITLIVALACWAVTDFEKKSLHQLIAAIKKFTNPFSVSDGSASIKTVNSIIWSPRWSCLRKSRMTCVNRVKQAEDCSNRL